jgi:hypothetical protein
MIMGLRKQARVKVESVGLFSSYGPLLVRIPGPKIEQGVEGPEGHDDRSKDDVPQ